MHSLKYRHSLEHHVQVQKTCYIQFTSVNLYDSALFIYLFTYLFIYLFYLLLATAKICEGKT